ncbi:hypothetical protein BASA83_009121 [Batrachochytrium salamandrivorans]|nr:hypothetical protein BASA83_009121 [Batrachochytrium salamandrivorans]
MSGNSSRSAAVTPLYNSDGIVQYDPTSILRVMQCHYGSLAADTTGHSLDLQYWHDRQPIQTSPNTPTIRNSDILDQDFSWNQIAAALLQMSPRKAPGDDGISTAFYQAALYMPANTQEGVPPTPFACALLRVCGQVFASATIPRAWLCASIVSIDKKDGDPLNPGDKRGIALINVGLKLVCKVLQMRIERFVETNNLLSYEQAGFRKREECVGQVVSLVDIIQRRQNAGLNTHVLFIDIRKAFDTVPVGALLWKLQNMGFPRRTLAFLKALYTSSYARARAGSLLSDPFPFLDYRETTNPIRGLMYADDVAVFADSEQSLLAASTAIEQWANQWEMQFGVAKCGIISFTGHLAPRLDNPLDIRPPWTVVVMGKAYYGLELVGGNKSHLAPLQTTINKGIRLFTGARLSTAIGPLLVETGIGSLLTRSLVSRVRLLERSVTKRTPINAICSGTDNDVFTLNVQGQLVRSQRWFWSRRTKQLYRNKYWLTPQVRPKTVKQRHSFALMETLRTCGDSASLQKYVTRQLLDTSGFFKDPSFDQSRAHGTRYLMLARMDALWTARKAIQIGILVDTHPFSVDHCILCDQQLLSTSIAHLVVECEQVTGHRIQSGLVPAIQKSRLRLLGSRTRSGCGEFHSKKKTKKKAAILARLEVGPVVPQVVVVGNDYPPLPPTGANPKRKTVATKPNTTTATTTTATIATTTDQPSKDTRFADAVKKRPTHQQLVERQPEFRKAGAAAWLALKRETSVPAHSAPKVELSSGLRLIYASGFPYAKPGNLRKAMQGARIRTSAVRDIR